MKHAYIVVILLRRLAGASHTMGRGVYEQLFQTVLGLLSRLQSEETILAVRHETNTTCICKLQVCSTKAWHMYCVICSIGSGVSHSSKATHTELITLQRELTFAQGLAKHGQQPPEDFAKFWQTSGTARKSSTDCNQHLLHAQAVLCMKHR